MAIKTQEPVYDFLLVINSKVGPILHCYWDTATYELKISLTPLSFSTLIRNDYFRVYGKALRFLKLVFQAVKDKDLVFLACAIFDW